MTIIGIAGKKGSGKDEVCKIIASHLPNVKRIAFADALKQEVARMYLVSVEYIEAHKKNFRLILQGHGTDYRRHMCGDDYWLKEFQKRVLTELRSSSDDITIVVPDVRFINEATLIHNLGGHVFLVKRDDYNEGPDLHASENELNDFNKFDWHINNGGSLKQLETGVVIALDMCALLPLTKPTTT